MGSERNGCTECEERQGNDGNPDENQQVADGIAGIGITGKRHGCHLRKEFNEKGADNGCREHGKNRNCEDQGSVVVHHIKSIPRNLAIGKN
jgi:hypothetical protein